MFSVNRGTHVLETSPVSSSDTEPLFWVASRNNETGVVFLKVGVLGYAFHILSDIYLYFTQVSNTGSQDLVANVFLDYPVSSGFGTAISISSPVLSPISGNFAISNTLDEPENIIPFSSSFGLPYADRFNYTFPATSVTVIALDGSDW